MPPTFGSTTVEANAETVLTGHYALSESAKLRATDSKYQKSHDKEEISDFILFHINVPFGELFSKITIKSSTALSFF